MTHAYQRSDGNKIKKVRKYSKYSVSNWVDNMILLAGNLFRNTAHWVSYWKPGLLATVYDGFSKNNWNMLPKKYKHVMCCVPCA